MVPSKRFEPVQRIAKSREDNAARELGHSQRRMQEQENKLEELKSYHQEYLDRFAEASRNGMSASQLQEYRAFMCKLETAIDAHLILVGKEISKKVVHASHIECSSCKDEWKQKRVRTQALGKVMDRFETTEKKAAESREQKESDEHGQRSKKF